jgi:hypothetical protein
MARYGRKDIEALVKRLEGRANKILRDEQPRLASDLRAAAVSVKGVLADGLEAVEVTDA